MNIFKFSQSGTRENNEDFLGNNEKAFIVCDGVGGHAAGEVASKHIVETVLKLDEQNKEDYTKTNIQQLLFDSQVSLNKLLEKNPAQSKMGTTFTGVFKTSEAWFAAHIGDSRIYLVRPQKNIVWHTWDHSLVGELMRTGEITREAGRNHPMGNRISRAIMANEKNKTVKADIVKIDYLEAGDFFMLCSDGVNEAWPEHELMHLLCDAKLSVEAKANTIKQKCRKLSKDNNTAYFVEISNKESLKNGNNEEITWISLEEIEEDYKNHLEYIKKQKDEDDDVVFVEHEEEHKPQKNKAPEADDNSTRSTQGKDISPFVVPQREKKRPIAVIIIVVLLAIIAYPGYELFVKDKTTTKPSDDAKREEVKKEESKTNVSVVDNKKEEEAWIMAIDKNTVDAFKTFKEEYPDSRYVEQASENINTLSKKAEDDFWAKAQEDSTINSYNAYLKRYPEGIYADDAKQEIEKKAWANTKEKDSIEAYKNFLKEFPDSEYRDKAEQKIKDEEAWREAVKINTIESYNAYKEEYPLGNHYKDAGNKIQELSKKQDWTEDIYQNNNSTENKFEDNSQKAINQGEE